MLNRFVFSCLLLASNFAQAQVEPIIFASTVADHQKAVNDLNRSIEAMKAEVVKNNAEIEKLQKQSDNMPLNGERVAVINKRDALSDRNREIDKLIPKAKSAAKNHEADIAAMKAGVDQGKFFSFLKAEYCDGGVAESIFAFRKTVSFWGMSAPLLAINEFLSNCKGGNMKNYGEFNAALDVLEKKCTGLEAPMSPFPNADMNRQQLRNSFSGLTADCVNGVALSRRYSSSLKFLSASLAK